MEILYSEISRFETVRIKSSSFEEEIRNLIYLENCLSSIKMK